MATMDVTGRYDSQNELLRFTVDVEDLQSDYTGSRQIVFELGSRGVFIQISTRSISGDGSYNFSTDSFTKGNTYVGRFKLQYKNEGAEDWTTALTETSSSIEVLDRPEDFNFSSSISSGAATTTLTASAWNSFCSRINEFEAYQGKSQSEQTYFPPVYSGDEMTASIIQRAWDAISDLNGHGSMPSRPTRGSTIYASFFHNLADALNNID